MDLARSVQVVTEEVMLRMARTVHKATGLENLCLAGGVALNCVGNGGSCAKGPFKRIWIQPAAGDAGGALGVAQLIWHRHLQQAAPRDARARTRMKGAYLGPALPRRRDRGVPQAESARCTSGSSGRRCIETVAELLADEKIVGWFNGRMEFGPRALGSRSILGDPRSPRMQAEMNLKIKFREGFRPFAPSVLRGAGRRLLRAGLRLARTCCWWRRCRRSARSR